jgi:hypothetical protein
MKMTTLPSLLALLVCVVGCDNPSDKQPASAPLERSQIVAAKAGDSAPPPPAQVVPAVASSAPKAPRLLCAGQMSAPGRAAP